MSHEFESVPIGQQDHSKRMVEFGGLNVAEVVTSIDFPVQPGDEIYKYLRTSDSSIVMATSSGTTGTPVRFSYTVPVGKTALLRRVNLSISDTKIRPQKFGGMSTGLAKGITLEIVDGSGSQLIDFCDDEPIKHNSDFVMLAGSDMDIITTNTSDDLVKVRWTLGKAGGSPLMTSGETFRLNVREDISDIIDMHAMVQGILFDAVE